MPTTELVNGFGTSLESDQAL